MPPELPRYALEPVRIDNREGVGPWLRATMFLLMGIAFALGFLLSR